MGRQRLQYECDTEGCEREFHATWWITSVKAIGLCKACYERYRRARRREEAIERKRSDYF